MRSISRRASAPALVSRLPVASSPLPSASAVRPTWAREAIRTPSRCDAWFGDRPHVNAVGSHEPTARELGAATIARGQVVVESRDAAMTEAGDLLMAFAEGVPVEVIRADLVELVHGAPVDRQQMTIFKSVGLAWQDLAVAALAYGRLAT